MTSPVGFQRGVVSTICSIRLLRKVTGRGGIGGNSHGGLAMKVMDVSLALSLRGGLVKLRLPITYLGGNGEDSTQLEISKTLQVSLRRV